HGRARQLLRPQGLRVAVRHRHCHQHHVERDYASRGRQTVHARLWLRRNLLFPRRLVFPGSCRLVSDSQTCSAFRTRMKPIQEGELLWTPSAERVARSHLTRYLRWLEARGQRFENYEALWRWSVADLPAFWQSMVDFCGLKFSQPAGKVLGRREMPGAEWFPGAKLNYAAQALR